MEFVGKPMVVIGGGGGSDGIAKQEAMKKDALRYRWLREQHNSTDSFTWHVRSNTTDIPDDVDAAIDAAMKAENDNS